MIVFWIVAGIMSAAVAGFILQSAARAAIRPQAADPAVGLYRRQLGEIDDLADRGLLAPAERKGAHAEAARRLLAAAEKQDAAAWSAAPLRSWVLAAAILVPGLAMGLYLAVGSPGTPDQPYAARLQAWRAADPSVLTAPQMTAVLSALVAERPRDVEALRYLAMAQGAADDPAGSVRTLRKAIILAPDRADLWESLGVAAAMAAGGEVTAQAQVAFREALDRDPKAVAARFHLARADIDAGDKAGGLAAWRELLAELPAADPRRADLQAAIAEVENAPAAKAPPQMAAIQGMVEGLAARLRADPDDAEGWVRLVRSYAVLGDTAKRDDALKAAQARFAGRREVLDALAAASRTEPMR